MSPESDSIQLQQWIRVRDADAFDRLAKRYAGIVFGTCLRITGNRPEAEDATQECFEALAGIAEVPRAPLGAWLHRVATNRALDRVRSNKRRRTRERAYASEQPSSVDPEWDDIYPLVDAAIAELPDKLRVLIVAHFLEGASYTAIADSIGVSRQVATNRVQKGVGVLRKSLRKRGVHVSAPSLAALMTAQLPMAEAVPAATAAAIGKVALAGTVQQTVTSSAAMTMATAGTTVVGGIAVTKPIIAGIGAIAAIVCTGAIYTFSNQAPAESNDATPLPVTVAGNANSAMTATDAERERLAQDLSQAEARIRELESEVSALNRPEVQPAPVEPAVKDEKSSKIPNLEEMRLKASLSREALAMAKSMTDLKFGNFLTDAQLPPETEAQVRELIADSQLTQLVLEEYGIKIAAEMKWAEYAAQVDEERAALSEQVRPLLTADQAAAWDAHMQNIDANMLNKALRSEIGMLSNALTPENMELAVGFGVDAFLGEMQALEVSETEFSAAERVHFRRRAIQTMREQLPAYLSPEQMAELENYLTFADNMLDKQLVDAEQIEAKRQKRHSQAN